MHSKRYAFFYGSQAKRYLDRIITLLVYVLFFPVIALILFLPLGYLVNEYQEGSVDMIVRILIYAFLVFLSALFMASVVCTTATIHSRYRQFGADQTPQYYVLPSQTWHQ